MASPLNLLSILVPEGWLLEYFSLMMPVKLGLAGVFFALFLKGIFGKEDFFLEKINYEAFMEELEEVSSEAEEIVFTENQEYLEWCEKTIEVEEEE